MKALTKDQIEVGKTYKIINNIQGSQFIKGDLVKVCGKYDDGIEVTPIKVFDKCLTSNPSPRTIKYNRLEPLMITLADMAEEILLLGELVNKTVLEITNLKKKQSWMLKNNVTEFSEDEYNMFEALTIIESKVSKMEKVKALTNLIKK